MTPFVIATMYKFVHLHDYASLQSTLLSFCRKHELKGTLLLAQEGINGTLAGSREGIDALLDFLRADSRLSELVHKESYADSIPFHRIKIKLRREIVTMGCPQIKPFKRGGTRVEPADWNAFIDNPDILLLDIRNKYEHRIGTFKNAEPSNTVNFREFPGDVKRRFDPAKNKKVAMFCTGGIRCEKASAWMLAQGFEEVYQLNGGILKYLQDIPAENSLWRGECFVFDERISVNHELSAGTYVQCFACRRPLSTGDIKSDHYQPGVSCPYCINETSEKQRAGFRERRRQVLLAEKRNVQHVGGGA